MPKFSKGSPQIKFGGNGTKPFTKTYHSADAASRAARGMKKAGYSILGIMRYGMGRTKKGNWV